MTPITFRNTLVVLEGLDACGKGTQTELLADALMAETFKFPAYANPSGQQILRAFNNPHPDPTLAAYSLQALQTINRLEERHLLHHLITGGNLVLDRYTASAFAYGMADGLDYEWLLSIVPTDIPQPDHQILIDIDVEDSFVRRPTRADAYEANRERLDMVRTCYLDLFAHPPATISHNGQATVWTTVDGRGTIAEVHQRILNCLR